MKFTLNFCLSILFSTLFFTSSVFAYPNNLYIAVKNTQKEIKEFESNYTKNTNINIEKYLHNDSFDSANSVSISNIAIPFVNNNSYFTNKTYMLNLSTAFFTKLIFLNKTGYLPFKPIFADYHTHQVTWLWNYKFVPKQLAGLTPHSQNNILYRGALKAFLHQNGFSLNNISNLPKNNNFRSQKPFVWILVNQKQPETLSVWQNGQWLAETNTNTGVNHTTPNGNFIIYARYKAFTMSGVFPINDQYYYDRNVPYVNFFYKGDAIHGFLRASYGYPQSAGCVELPVKTAKKLFRMFYTGSVVTIIH